MEFGEARSIRGSPDLEEKFETERMIPKIFQSEPTSEDWLLRLEEAWIGRVDL